MIESRLLESEVHGMLDLPLLGWVTLGTLPFRASVALSVKR